MSLVFCSVLLAAKAQTDQHCEVQAYFWLADSTGKVLNLAGIKALNYKMYFLRDNRIGYNPNGDGGQYTGYTVPVVATGHVSVTTGMINLWVAGYTPTSPCSNFRLAIIFGKDTMGIYSEVPDIINPPKDPNGKIVTKADTIRFKKGFYQLQFSADKKKIYVPLEGRNYNMFRGLMRNQKISINEVNLKEVPGEK